VKVVKVVVPAAHAVTMRAAGDALPGLTLRAQVAGAGGAQLRVIAATGTAALGTNEGESFVRATGEPCP
jgi:hypothetical protein